MYVPSVESCMGVFKEDMVYIQGVPFWGGGPSTPETDDGSSYGILAAIDPVGGEVKWKYRSEYPFVGGALATAGGVVFQVEIKTVTPLLWMMPLEKNFGDSKLVHRCGANQSHGRLMVRSTLPLVAVWED